MKGRYMCKTFQTNIKCFLKNFIINYIVNIDIINYIMNTLLISIYIWVIKSIYFKIDDLVSILLIYIFLQ